MVEPFMILGKGSPGMCVSTPAIMILWGVNFDHKLYIEIAKEKTPKGSTKKRNYRVEKKGTSW